MSHDVGQVRSNSRLARVVLKGWDKQRTASDGTTYPIWPVLQVLNASNEIASMVRMTGPEFEPTIFNSRGRYTVRILLPEESDEPLAVFKNQSAGGGPDLVVEIPSDEI